MSGDRARGGFGNATFRLADVAPEIEKALTWGGGMSTPLFGSAQIRCEKVWVTMRDGIRLATDVYLPPVVPAPSIAVRTPYDRANDRLVGGLISFARRGYVVVAQDCRGTGESEPDVWDYYMYEGEDGFDLVQWIVDQKWFDGFLGTFGGSYAAQTQWCMATHPRMSTFVPQVSGLGVGTSTVHLYMFVNAYARSVGKGEGKVPIQYTDMERLMETETMSGGYFNEPLHRPPSAALTASYPELATLEPKRTKEWLWIKYCALSCAQRADFVKRAFDTSSVSIVEVESLSEIFGQQISHDAHTLPTTNRAAQCRVFNAPPLMITGWYDWALNDALATWEVLTREAQPHVRSASRLIIAPSAHNMPGYHEGMQDRPELRRDHRSDVELLLQWYSAVRKNRIESWPTVIYYLMGENEWRVASCWPPAEARLVPMYFGSDNALSPRPPEGQAPPARYTYRPNDPTPTVGGSIVSYVYTPGSVDCCDVQRRSDILAYTSEPLDTVLDVVGPLRMVLYASSSAIDTDFSARLCDVFPDGRAIQLQSGILRARYRHLGREPELLVPGRIYCFEIDMWATANRFKIGHRLRVDISSADFPRFDRNSNRGGEPGEPVPAQQTVYHDAQHPSHILLSVLQAH